MSEVIFFIFHVNCLKGNVQVCNRESCMALDAPPPLIPGNKTKLEKKTYDHKIINLKIGISVIDQF